MVDVVDKETRSRMMSGIKGKNTKPEMLIRKSLHARGFRYKLYDKKLPGKPDIVFPKYKAVIFINGCFWHGHECSLFKWPKTKQEFWYKKITGNKKRDSVNISKLLKSGWRVLIIWECALKGKRKYPIEKVIDITSEWLILGGEFLEISGQKEEK